jgi:hypothetical protein
MCFSTGGGAADSRISVTARTQVRAGTCVGELPSTNGLEGAPAD